METTEQRNAKNAARKSEGFQTFMARDEVKLMLSMVPKAEPPELLETLLKSAFDSGHGCGEDSLAVDMITAMLDGKGKRDERGF